MEIENTVSSDFDMRSSIVKIVFDCYLSGVILSSENIYSEYVCLLVMSFIVRCLSVWIFHNCFLCHGGSYIFATHTAHT